MDSAQVVSTMGSIISGVVANAITGFVRWVYGRSQAARLTTLTAKAPFSTLLQRAAANCAKNLASCDPALATELADFLNSGDAEQVLQHFFATELIGPNVRNATRYDPRTWDLFHELLRLRASAAFADSPAARTLFIGLLASAERILEGATGQGIVGSVGKTVDIRLRLLSDQVAALDRKLTFLGGQKQIDAAHTFVADYRALLRTRFMYVSPQHLSAQRRVPIDSIYVCPDFVWLRASSGGTPEELSEEQLRDSLHRVVVLGSPGAGKSTFAQKLCYDLAVSPRATTVSGRTGLLPIYIVLREYDAWQHEHGIRIRQYMEDRCLLQATPPSGFLEYGLLHGSFLVVFDGLDELLNTARRRRIRDEVESFCQLYPETPVVVSSRYIGYEQAPLDASRFSLVRIADFDDGQVGTYVRKWFLLDDSIPREEQERKAERLIQESASVRDLRANALMLGLICALYRGDGYIPKNRPDVIQRCAELLFEKWDASREIRLPVPIANLHQSIAFLAYWMYTTERQQKGVTENLLVDKAVQYLWPDKYEDNEEARYAARQFVEWCRGRGWVFTDTGTTDEGHSLYQFTHRTFLEYFTAVFLSARHVTPAELAAELMTRIFAREWDVVVDLAFHIKAQALEKGADALIQAILNAVEKDKSVTFAAMSFAARSLSHLLPSAYIVREVVERCLCFVEGVDTGKDIDASLLAQELLGALFGAREDNQSATMKAVRDHLSLAMLDVAGSDAAKRIECCLGLFVAAPGGAGVGWQARRVEERWLPHVVESLLRQAEKGLVVRVAAGAPALGAFCYYWQTLEAPDLIGLYGLPQLFRCIPVRPYNRAVTPVTHALASQWLRCVCGIGDDDVWSRCLSGLAAIGTEVIRLAADQGEAPGVLKADDADQPALFSRLIEALDGVRGGGVARTCDGESLFGLLCIMGVEIERLERGMGRSMGADIGVLLAHKSFPGAYSWMTQFFSARRAPLGKIRSQTFDRVVGELSVVGLAPVQRAILARWLKRELDLIVCGYSLASLEAP